MCDFDDLQEKKPLVSVLIASYYSGEPLFCAIKSVLDQDYQNIELIICDDGTEGFPEERVHALLWGHSRIKYTLLRQPVNVGTVKNLNCGLRQAQGQWIMLMAADDVLAAANAVSSMVAQVMASGKRWIVPQTALCDDTLERKLGIMPDEETQRRIRNGEAAVLYEQMCFHCCYPSSGVIYRSNLVKEQSQFDEQYRLVEDWPLFLKLLRKNILPDISEDVFVYHRGDGVSGKRAGKNECYQQDLIHVMEREILPYLSCIANEKRKNQLLQQILDKKAVFEYRFVCNTIGQRLRWLIHNMAVVRRKIAEKYRGDSLC